MFVYLITNRLNGKVYVGKTVQKNLDSYFRHNLRNAESGRKDKNYLYSAIRKYGSDAFTVQPICRPTSENLMSALECWYIGHYGCNNPEKGYNLTSGGDGVSGMMQSEFSKQKLRERSIGNTWRRGSVLSDETKQRISDSKKIAYQNGLQIWNKNKPWSQETRNKMSLSAKRRWLSKEQRDLAAQASRKSAAIRRGAERRD